GRDLLVSPQLDEETRRAMQLRRFRSQAVRAVRETVYYQRLFERLGLDPGRVRYEEIAHLPLTPKADLRSDPEAFVCHTAHPSLRALTTGTTGWPTSVSFSAYELRVYAALTAISALFSGEITSEDIVQMSTSSRGTLGNVCLAGACAHIGALVYLAGVTEPAHALALLAEKHHLTGKKTRTSVLYTYPSYLGERIECGRVVHLRCWRDLSFAEIGRFLKMPETTAKTYFYRARPLLGAALAMQTTVPARRSTRRNRLGEGVSRSCSRRGPSSTPW